MTNYPNREHEKADVAMRRRALKTVNDILAQAALLRRKLISPNPLAEVFGSDTQVLAADVAALTTYLAGLEALRDVREWDAANESASELMTVKGP